MKTDVLVIGSGPAGAAAAISLVRQGVRVTLVDKAEFPRDKTCGDALIPDALAALEGLSLREPVLRQARLLDRIRLYSANGRFATLRGVCACLPRVVLDNLLLTAAREAGAEFLPAHEADRPIVEHGAVAGASVRETRTKACREIRARTTLLACGASAGVLQRFGVALRSTPNAIACRQYFQIDAEAARDVDFLCLSYIREISPGYGWIFPGPDDIFNIGIGCFYDMKLRTPKPNLAILLARFLESFPLARNLIKSARALTPVRGAAIRTAMGGARFSRPGLLVVGEAAGLTYSFSGEGIGKAMESGILAGNIIAETAAGAPGSDTIAERYAEHVTRLFGARFRAYRRAQDWLAHAWVGNLLTRRAVAGSYVRGQLEGIFNETVDPGVLFSPAGLARALLF